MYVWEFFRVNNLIPYLLVVGMGFVTYYLWIDNIEKGIELRESKVLIDDAHVNMGIIQEYNEKRFKELSKIRKTVWKEGEHEGSF